MELASRLLFADPIKAIPIVKVISLSTYFGDVSKLSFSCTPSAMLFILDMDSNRIRC